jgi:hypothetical protein
VHLLVQFAHAPAYTLGRPCRRADRRAQCRSIGVQRRERRRKRADSRGRRVQRLARGQQRGQLAVEL